MKRIKKELKGKHFGSLTVRYFNRSGEIGCRCSCGRWVLTSGSALRDGSVTSCGCGGLGPKSPSGSSAEPIRLMGPFSGTASKPGEPAEVFFPPACRPGREFPQMLEKKVGMLTVLARIPKEYPEDPLRYLSLCTCGGFTLLRSRAEAEMTPVHRPIPLTRLLEDYAKNGPMPPDYETHATRDLLLAGSDLQCTCYSARARYVPGPLPPEPHIRSEDQFLYERMRAGSLKKYHDTHTPGVYYSHRRYLPGVRLRGEMHFLGSFSSPDYAGKIAQWAHDIRLEEWMDRHRDAIDPEKLRRNTLGVHYDFQQKWLAAFDPSRADDDDYLWKAIRMNNGRQFLYHGIKYVLRIRDGKACILQGDRLLNVLPKSEAVKGEGFMRPVFLQLGINVTHIS